MIVLPTRASNNKIVYVRHCQAEIGGESSRLCDSAQALLRTLARIMILAAKNIEIVRALFVINSPLL